MALFSANDFSGAENERIGEALAAANLETTPANLAAAKSSSEVTVSQRGAEPAPPAQDQGSQPSEQSPPPAGPTPAEQLATQAAAVPAQAMTVGVLVPTLIAGAIGAAVWAPFALLFCVAGVGVWFALRRWRFWFARIFFWPLRSIWAAGFFLALAPMLILSAVVSAAFVAPTASKHASDNRHRQAVALVRRGHDELRRGDLDSAEHSLKQAEDRDRDANGEEELKRAIGAEHHRRNQQGAYDEAKQEIQNDQSAKARALLATLEGSGDNDTLVEKLRGDLAAYDLRAARRLFAEGSYSGARQAAARSLRSRTTAAAQNLRFGADRKVAQQLAAERAQARVEVAARKARREQAKREAAASRAEEERQAAEEAAPLPDDYSTGSGSVCANGTPYPQLPGQRDGDGDGCYGE